MRFLVALMVVFALGQTARAQGDSLPGDRAEAARLFERGMGHFRLDEYDKAVAVWQEGFRIKPVPEFLFNIAQAYRLGKQPEQALSYYKKYLYVMPNAPNRAEVQRHIATLEAAIEEHKRLPGPAPEVKPTAPGPTPSPATTPPVATPPPAPTPPPASQSSPTTASAMTVTATPPPPKRITKRPWFWAVIGVSAAVVVGGAVALGVVLGRADNNGATLPGVAF